MFVIRVALKEWMTRIAQNKVKRSKATVSGVVLLLGVFNFIVGFLSAALVNYIKGIQGLQSPLFFGLAFLVIGYLYLGYRYAKRNR